MNTNLINKKLEEDIYKISFKLLKLNCINTSNNNFIGGDYEIILIKNILKKKLKNKFRNIILNGGQQKDNYQKLKIIIVNFTQELTKKLNNDITRNIKNISANITNELLKGVDKTIIEVSKTIIDGINNLNMNEIIDSSRIGATSQYITSPIQNVAETATKGITSGFGLFSKKK